MTLIEIIFAREQIRQTAAHGLNYVNVDMQKCMNPVKDVYILLLLKKVLIIWKDRKNVKLHAVIYEYSRRNI